LVVDNAPIQGLAGAINHSPTEAAAARNIAEATGLVCRSHYVHDTPLRPRTRPAVLTLWHHS